MKQTMQIALVGQPNSGKSTVFNMLTGARQHVANYPGVTVDVKRGSMKHGDTSVEVVDLPGAYSLTSYSPEEMVTRDHILHGDADCIVNVADASNLKRHLYLTFQLLEMGAPLILNLNMTDIASGRGISVDEAALSRALDIPVVTSVANRGRGGKDLKNTIVGQNLNSSSFHMDYGPLEPALEEVAGELKSSFPDEAGHWRWMAVKLFEGDEALRERLSGQGTDGEKLLSRVDALTEEFFVVNDDDPVSHIGLVRHLKAQAVETECVSRTKKEGRTLTDRIDAVVMNRFAGPVILMGVIYALYELSIVQGYKLTAYVVPWLNRFQMAVQERLPMDGFWQTPLLRGLIDDVVTGINSVLIYIPIFLILFAAIAVLEDVGYMPRMAFILDRVFRRFGLHGQSTLPLILGGVFVGGCAVPGVMACRGIADEKARLATILIVPLMNCMAKIPLYTLLVSVFFVGHQGMMMVFISTITLIVALSVAKILTMTVLKNRPSSPFVMEMPVYHMPTITGVARRSVERTWLFVKKILTVIMLVSVAVFFLTHYPGISKSQKADFQARADSAMQSFEKSIAATPYATQLADEEELLRYIDMDQRYRKARLSGMDREKMEAKFSRENKALFSLIIGEGSAEKTVSRAYKKLRRDRMTLQKEYSSAQINNSILGRAGAALEPVTRYAGFNWKVNVALLSSLAAKESSVATLGVLYKPIGDAPEQTVGERMKEQEKGFTPLHALALMLFMAFYPPCLATMLMVRMEAGGWKWALFSLGYATALGLFCASLVFTGGRALGLTALPAAWTFYGLALAFAIVMGMINPSSEKVELEEPALEGR